MDDPNPRLQAHANETGHAVSFLRGGRCRTCGVLSATTSEQEDPRSPMPEKKTYPCCACCKGVAMDDHVEYGGTVEKDGHTEPCSSCEVDARVRQSLQWPRLKQAWDEGHDAACHGFARMLCAHTNPYERTH